MRLELIAFGVIEVEGVRYEHDVVIEAGVVRKRHKGASKPYARPLRAYAPLDGGGHPLVRRAARRRDRVPPGQLPVMDEVVAEAAAGAWS